MRKVASSVAVITTAHDVHLHGMTATAISSVSADPPTLLVVNKTTRTHPLIVASRHFVVNILSQSQQSLGTRFSGKVNDQFSGVGYRLSAGGLPILRDCTAHFECGLMQEFDAGTHTIFIGSIVAGGFSDNNPLLYHDGAYKYLLQM